MLPFVAAVLVSFGISWATQQGRVPTADPGDRTPYTFGEQGPG